MTSNSAERVVDTDHDTNSQVGTMIDKSIRDCEGRSFLQSGALELGDGLLDDRVPPVVGLDLGQRRSPVRDERVEVLAVSSASCEPGVGRTRRTTRRT